MKQVRSRASLRLLACGAAVALLAAGCGGGGEEPAEDTAADDAQTDSDGGGEEEPDDSAPAEATDTGAWDADAPPEWDELLERAQQDGEVTVAGPAPLATPMAEA